MVWGFSKLKHGWRGFNGDQMTAFWPTFEQARAEADSIDDSRNENHSALTGEGYICDVCGLGFSVDEWDERCDDDDEPDRYYHADCCPICAAYERTSADVYGEVTP